MRDRQEKLAPYLQALPGILAEDAAQEQVFVAGAAEGTALGFRLLQGQL